MWYRYARRWYAGRYAGGRAWWRRNSGSLRGWSADSATLAYAIHKKRMRRLLMNRLRSEGVTVNDVTIFRFSDSALARISGATGERAWPEIMGMPPVVGNYINEVVHTGTGSYRWIGTGWLQRILQ